MSRMAWMMFVLLELAAAAFPASAQDRKPERTAPVATVSYARPVARMAATARDDAILAFVPADDVPLDAIRQTELAGAAAPIHEGLQHADRLVRRKVQYRSSTKTLSRRALPTSPESLSCSEFVWYVQTSSGLDLGEKHLKTDELAHRADAYSPSLERVTDGSVKPGDLLVYNYSPRELARQKQSTGKTRSGHVVMVVSAKERIVVGSHYRESTPDGAPTGAGYRRVLGGWNRWTHGRVLQAVYRVKNGWRDDRRDESESPAVVARGRRTEFIPFDSSSIRATGLIPERRLRTEFIPFDSSSVRATGLIPESGCERNSFRSIPVPFGPPG